MAESVQVTTGCNLGSDKPIYVGYSDHVGSLEMSIVQAEKYVADIQHWIDFARAALMWEDQKDYDCPHWRRVNDNRRTNRATM